MTEFESTPGERPPISETSIIYDSRDGRIVHVHEFIGDGTGIYGPGGQEERGRQALDGARRHHNDADRLRVMHLPRDFRFDHDTLYRVDLRSGQLAARADVSVAALIERRRNRKKGTR